jgi:hypothetical protein
LQPSTALVVLSCWDMSENVGTLQSNIQAKLKAAN